ncbi:hypothetical protein DMUE_3561 [Dictyocoela muelleri]|nr:hypothetical protein DMUE_3561 [Dictyocoela muelleri]
MQETQENIIKYYLDGLTSSQISLRLNKNRTTVSKIITKFLKTGRISTNKSGGNHATKLNDIHKNAIKQYLNEDATLSLRMLREKLITNHQINVSIKTIDRVIQFFLFTKKVI